MTERRVFRLTAEDLESATATAPSHATRPVHSCGLSWRRPITREVQPHIFDGLQDAQAFHSQIQAQLNAKELHFDDTQWVSIITDTMLEGRLRPA